MAYPDLLPLDAGEQYRFSFDMSACVGCHSCEVACAEQNDLPVDVSWRKVGEIEGGSFPDARRFSLSMACNHCVEPTCLSGCPTDAYTKLPNGVVQHHPDECIGCQYCIWNCPYEVPVFDRTRKIVSKCDLCLPRLEAGQSPACVSACPTKAISVEKVRTEDWRSDHHEADGPGLPPAEITLSTTRVVQPTNLPDGSRAVNHEHFEPEDPHVPLIVLTLLTQLALGTVGATVLLHLVAHGSRADLAGAAGAALVAGLVALGASVFHLGRPAAALKALRNLRRSWLSREVALFPAFSAASFAFAAIEGDGRAAAGLVAVALGIAGVYASGRIYLVPARPVWNSGRTLVSFFATAFATGPLLALALVDRSDLSVGWVAGLVAIAALGVIAQLAAHAHLAHATRGAEDRQHRGTAVLLRRFRSLVMIRLGLALGGLLMLASLTTTPLAGPAAGGRLVGAFALVGGAELIARYLFYVTVVPWSVAGGFSGARR